MWKRIILSSACLSMLALWGCPGGGSEEAVDPTIIPEGDGKSVEVVVFEGGYGKDFFEQATKEFADEKGIEYEFSGDPSVWDQLRPRFVAGDPPDVTWPGWSMDYWGLVYDQQLVALDRALDEPAWGETEGKWRDTLDEGLLKMGQHEGHQYMMPYHANLNGWWYNKQLFEKNGWTPPTTFEELLTLNDKIKATGAAPLTYQGQYPYYMLFGFLFPWIISEGGIEAYKACANLEPGAWESPAVLKAAEMIDTLRKRGDFQQGAIGLDHTSSQIEFLKGNAAMIPCGTWLVSEMKNYMETDMPGVAPSQIMEFMLPPVLANGKGDPTALMVAIEPWVVPIKGKNPRLGVEYFRYLTSKEKAQQFMEEKGTIVGVKGLDASKYPSHLKEPGRLFNEASTKWNAEFRLWYPDFADKMEGAMSSLLSGKLTPQEFCARVEADAQAVAKDSSIPKHKVE